MNANMQLEPRIKALVIGYRSHPHNLGKVVELVRFMKKGCFYNRGFVDADYWIVSGDNLEHISAGEVICGPESIISPKYLMPIRPEADPMVITQQMEERV